MLDHSKIKLALRNNLLNIPGFPFTDIKQQCYENEEFKPPTPIATNSDSGSYFKESYVPGDEIQTAWGVIEGNGLYQIDIYIPWGLNGTGRGEEIRKMVADAFDPRNVDSVTYGGVYVVIVRTTPLPGRTEKETWYILSTQVSWRCHDIQ
jgi:hypothetical protein